MKTRRGYSKLGHDLFGDFYTNGNMMPCEKCGTVSVCKDEIDGEIVCYACFRKHEEEEDREREKIIERYEKRRAELLGK